MNGRAVGKLVRAAGGAMSFQYHAEWAESPEGTPISLSMPLSADPYTGDVVYNYFDNLLPDNENIRQRMQATLGTDTAQPFDLLAAAGADCIGALQMFETADMPDVRRIEATPVSDAEIAQTLRDYRLQPLGMAPDRDDFRISIAGAQEKTALLWHGGRWNRPRGTTPTTHVFKLPIGVIEKGGIDLSRSVQNEWLCLKLAAAFGLDVPEARIESFEDVTVLVVERFDRHLSDDGTWLIRIPQEDACQALGFAPGMKYEGYGGPGIPHILELLLQSTRANEDRSAFFRACIVNWLLAATDGHAKNFSVFLQPGGRCRMTPVYDVMSIYPMLKAKQITLGTAKMAMAVTGKNRHYRWDGIHRRHWISTARACKFSENEAEAILEDCGSRIDDAIASVGAELPDGFPAQTADPIFTGLRKFRRRI